MTSLLQTDVNITQSLSDLSSKTELDKQNLQKSMTSLLQSDVKLNQSLTDLSSKARQEPDIFFTAVAHYGWVDQNKSPVFYSPISNQGSAFDNNTGIFTATHSGFYHFELHIYSTSHDAYFNLEKNGVSVVSVRCYGDDGNRGSSNSVYLRLDPGDKVSAVAVSRSYVFGVYSTFSGRLIALV